MDGDWDDETVTTALGQDYGRTITVADLDRELAAVAATTADPAAGVFGPGSASWRVNREAAVFLGAGRALLLQLAHPWVAAAIGEHSTALTDPVRRFHGTFGTVYAMVFGPLDQALGVARGLHGRHAAARGRLPSAAGPFPAGSPYAANDRAALAWVQATLTDSAVLAHDLVLPPLTPVERERCWREARRFAGLFGIRAGDLPPDWTAFAAYNRAMHASPVLTVSPQARAIGLGLLTGGGGGGRRWLRAPAWYAAVTAALLPEQVREGYGLPYGPAERLSVFRALRRLRALYPRLPGALRFVPPYHEALARLAGRRPAASVRLLNRAWIGRPLLTPP